MKNTAHLPALLFAALAVTASAADTAPAPTAPTAPAHADVAANPATPAESPKVETATVAALTPATPAAPAPSSNLTPLASPKPEDNTLAPATDPNVVQLPKMVVKQKPRPRLTPEVMVTKQAFGEDLAKKNTQLDQVLNKYTLPLFGSSAAERALDEYERAKRDQINKDVANIANALETTDPTEAKSLKEAARP